MSAGKYKIVCEKGSTFDLQIQWKDSAGVVIPVIGYTAKLQVRTDKSSDIVVVEMSTTNSRITLHAEGIIKLNMSATVTDVITPMNYIYDLELTSSTGVVTRLLEGQFLVEDGVTR